MAKITYKNPDSTEETLEVSEGTSVMRAAIMNSVDGIIGECGGQAMCATCHVYVQEVNGSLPEISEDEEEMLELTASELADNSRLGCQLKAGDHFESISVTIPESQV